MSIQFNEIKKSIQYGSNTLTIETGKIARQASGAVKISLGDTVLLVTAVGAKEATPGRGFFPLTVDYREKAYAAGKIPGGFFKREGRSTEIETLTCRLIDRPVRPLFPKEFLNEVQVIATVISVDPQISPDIPALVGASAALAISGMPWNGPIAGARVGYLDGAYVLNPSYDQLDVSELDLIVAGTKKAVLMVESDAAELSEEIMLGGVLFGHEQMQPVIDLIKELASEAGKPKWDWAPPETNTALETEVSGAVRTQIEDAYKITDKVERTAALRELKNKVIEQFAVEDGDVSSDEVKGIFAKIEKSAVRTKVLAGDNRIDGRNTTTVRPISTEVGILPRTHGSALFTRGETQAIVVATIGVGRDAQIIDAIEGEFKEHFMLHYNFPPFCVGEVGMQFGPKRREIGHGRLAKRAIAPVLPSDEEFPYVIRVVSEITESNGSSSMASVCGTSLALMDAGVPIRAPVAGIAMGLVKEGDNFVVLSDILGDEDHLGDMDFKVAGTKTGITALQMDIKIEGINKEIMEKALHQAKEGRLHILDVMSKSLTEHRPDMSKFAPRITTIQVHKDKIRDVIGKGGATIRGLIEETGATIDINDEGLVTIASSDDAASSEAKRRIEEITADVEVGNVYEGKVAKLVDFGAFVTIFPGKDGLLHISQIAEERVENVGDYLQEGQNIKVKVLDVDRQGRIKLSMKPADLA